MVRLGSTGKGSEKRSDAGRGKAYPRWVDFEAVEGMSLGAKFYCNGK